MTAVIHLTNGKAETVSNLKEVWFNGKSGFGEKNIPAKDAPKMTIANNTKYTFVGESLTIAFTENTIQYVEFNQD